VLRVFHSLCQRALRVGALHIVGRPTLGDPVPPFGHRQHDADEILEIERGGYRRLVVDCARQAVRIVPEGAPCLRLPLGFQPPA
jgi:hypothetical protein